MPFTFKKLDIPDVQLIEPKVFSDNRGLFNEIFKSSDFKQFGINKEFVQINYSKSKNGVLRGLHYQLEPYSQGKLIQVIAGEIFDVAVDIRNDSLYYGKWVAENLSAVNKRMIFIPEGFAHGFCVLSEAAEIIYYCTNASYTPEHERGVIWNDSELQIDWPIKKPILSAKDAQLPIWEKHNETQKNTNNRHCRATWERI